MLWRLAGLLALGVVSAARKTIDLRELDEAYNVDEDEDVWETKKEKERRLKQASEQEALLAEPDLELPEGGGSISGEQMERLIARAKANGKFTQGSGPGPGAAAAPPGGGPPPPGGGGMPGGGGGMPPGMVMGGGAFTDNSMKLMEIRLKEGVCEHKADGDTECCDKLTRVYKRLLLTGGILAEYAPTCTAFNEILLVMQGAKMIGETEQIVDFFLGQDTIAHVQHDGVRKFPDGTSAPSSDFQKPGPAPKKPSTKKSRKKRKKKATGDDAKSEEEL